MQSKKIIYCTVTNDLNQDQRMHRICLSLHKLGHEVILVGRSKMNSKELLKYPFKQKRLNCFFQRGFTFYAEYNIRLFLFLLFRKLDILYAVDLDTIAVGSLVKLLRTKKLVFDAHEYFEETPEVYKRRFVKSIWSFIGRTFVPLADAYITVNQSLAHILGKLYNRSFTYIYNTPEYTSEIAIEPLEGEKPYLLYQGVLNKGRGIAELIKAMEYVNHLDLYIIGDGDLSSDLKKIAVQSKVSESIKFLGWLSPDEMKKYTLNATLGINLLERSCESYYYSLANKFFDYLHMGIPSVNMDFPEYRNIINKYDNGILVVDLSVSTIANAINKVVNDNGRIELMRKNSLAASKELNWQNEEKKLYELFENLTKSTTPT